MSDSSRSRVTITLGRSGQVVKRDGAEVDGVYPSSLPSAGTKRSVHDRLGTNVKNNNKRHRGNGNTSSTSSADDEDGDGVPLRRDDLRYKIMQKSKKKGTEGDNLLDGVDLREILSRQVQVRSSTTNGGSPQLMPSEKNGRQYMPDGGEVRHLMSDSRGDRQHMPEDRDIRLPDTREVRQRKPELREVQQRIPEMREVRERMPEIREVRERMPEMRELRERRPEMREVREHIPEKREVRERMPERREVRERMPERREVREQMPERREVREQMPERREVREQMPETREVRQHMPGYRDDRQRMLEPTGASIMRRIPSSRGVDDVPRTDSIRNSYPPWTLDPLRRRSPDRIVSNSRGASPPRNEEELRRRSSMRALDNVRSAAYFGKDSLELRTPMGTASYMTNSALAAGPAKRVGPMLSAPPPGVIIHKSSYTVNEQHTVEGLLLALGLEKYVINFKAEEVDMHALRQMGDNDLKDLGIPMGPRKKILLALLPRSRRQG